MIIGGQAVLVHGEPRTTRDIDVTLGVDVDRLDDVLAVTTRLGLATLVDAKTFTPKTMVLPCNDPRTGVRVDLLFSFSPYEQQAIARAITKSIGVAHVRFASVEDLVVHKLVAGRPRDLEDVVGVLAKHPDVEVAYVRTWLRQFEDALERPLVPTFDDLLARR
jgi:hypothetical protein